MSLSPTACPAYKTIRHLAVATQEAIVHEVLKQLSKLTEREVQELDDLSLRRLAEVCQRWHQVARAEIARRKFASR